MASYACFPHCTANKSRDSQAAEQTPLQNLTRWFFCTLEAKTAHEFLLPLKPCTYTSQLMSYGNNEVTCRGKKYLSHSFCALCLSTAQQITSLLLQRSLCSAVYHRSPDICACSVHWALALGGLASAAQGSRCAAGTLGRGGWTLRHTLTHMTRQRSA